MIAPVLQRHSLDMIRRLQYNTIARHLASTKWSAAGWYGKPHVDTYTWPLSYICLDIPREALLWTRQILHRETLTLAPNGVGRMVNKRSPEKDRFAYFHFIQQYLFQYLRDHAVYERSLS